MQLVADTVGHRGLARLQWVNVRIYEIETVPTATHSALQLCFLRFEVPATVVVAHGYPLAAAPVLLVLAPPHDELYVQDHLPLQTPDLRQVRPRSWRARSSNAVNSGNLWGSDNGRPSALHMVRAS